MRDIVVGDQTFARHTLWSVVVLVAVTLPTRSFAQVKQSAERVVAIDAEIAKLAAANGNKADFSRDVWKQLDEAIYLIEARATPHELCKRGLQERFDELVARIRADVEHLKTEDAANGAPYTDRLRTLESTWNHGNLELVANEAPMVQWIHFGGEPDTIDPDESVLVKLQIDAKRPVMLMLTSNRKTKWDIHAQDASSVRAVVVGPQSEQVECNHGTWVFHRKLGLYWPTLRLMESLRRRPVDEFGQEAEVLLPVFEANQPVTLSPENPNWLRAYVLGRLRLLHADTRANRNRLFLEAESNLCFRGIGVEYRGNIGNFQTLTTTCDFNLFGPLEKTKRPTKMHLWNLTPSGRTTFGIRSRQLVKQTADQNWRSAEMPTTWRDGRMLRSISYDAQRNRLLGLGHGGDLFSRNMESAQWTRIRKGIAGSIALVYAEDRDQILVLCQSVDPHHTWRKRTSVLFLDATGKNVKAQELMCGESMQHGSAGANELTVSRKYLIAVQPSSLGQELPAEPVIRVFDLTNGEMVYDYMIEPEVGSTKIGVLPTSYSVLRKRLNEIREQLAENKDTTKAVQEQLEFLVRKKMDRVIATVDGDAAVEALLAQLEELATKAGIPAE